MIHAYEYISCSLEAYSDTKVTWDVWVVSIFSWYPYLSKALYVAFTYRKRSFTVVTLGYNIRSYESWDIQIVS